jgi:hypothetical protein
MSLEDKFACAELIQSWGLYRDQHRWDELLSTFHPDGEIAVSWFRGPFHEFVEHCKRGNPSKHLIFAPLVRIAGDRALAETSIMILVRQAIEGLAVDMTSRARFLDRLERREGQWRILERAAIYEQDRLDPVEPSTAFGMVMRASSADDYPEAYRYMALRPPAARWPSRSITTDRLRRANSMSATRRGSRACNVPGPVASQFLKSKSQK